MKLRTLKEELIYEDSEVSLVAVLSEKDIKLTLRGGSAEVLGKLGMKKAGALGSLAMNHLKRYDKLKAANRRTVAFYARNAQERRAYEKVVKNLTKSKEYKIVRTFPYANGARMWELKKVKV